MKYAFFIVDAFSSRPFGGNTAGVVLLNNAFFPGDDVMQQVAAELRYSETVFVRRQSAGRWEARYFTPRGEVDLCGHATVAAFVVLHAKGMAQGTCSLSTRSGQLQVVAGRHVMLLMPTPSIVGTLGDSDIAEAYRVLGLDPVEHGGLPAWPPQMVSAGLPDVMLPVASVEALNGIRPDMEAVAALTTRLGAVSLHLFALGDGYTAHVRDFAPAYGVPEESATGTANASLTHYLATHGIIAAGDHRFLQGEAMGRPSVVETRLDADGSLWVGGSAAIVAEGRIFV